MVQAGDGNVCLFLLVQICFVRNIYIYMILETIPCKFVIHIRLMIEERQFEGCLASPLCHILVSLCCYSHFDKKSKW